MTTPVVLHNTPVWLPQTQTWMFNQLRFLPAGVRAHVVCDRTENLDQFKLPNLHSLAEKSPLALHWSRGLQRFGLRRHSAFAVKVARHTGANILHSHFGPYGWSDMGLSRLAGLKHIVTFYGADLSYFPSRFPVWRQRYRELFRHADMVLCEGPHMRKCLAELGCPPGKIRIQRLGVALNEIPFRPLPWRPGEPLRVLMASSFREKKGLPVAIDALGRLKDRLKLEITVIGDAGNDPREAVEKRRIAEAISRNNLAPVLDMKGFRPYRRLLAEARRHHIFLSPSLTAGDGDTEGGAPVSLIEMSASGMIAVSTRHCDIPQVIIDGQTGLLADEGDVDGLYEKLVWLAEHPDAWERLRMAARRHVESCFDAARQAGALAKLYQELLA